MGGESFVVVVVVLGSLCNNHGWCTAIHSATPSPFGSFSIDFEENGPNGSPVVLNWQRVDVFMYCDVSRVTYNNEVHQLTDEAD
jgi:hypothetical protein